MHEGVYAKPLPNHELWCRLVRVVGDRDKAT
jgi:hypothetical protein